MCEIHLNFMKQQIFQQFSTIVYYVCSIVFGEDKKYYLGYCSCLPSNLFKFILFSSKIMNIPTVEL